MASNVPSGFQVTEAGLLPNEWRVATIAQAMKLINGRAFKPSEWSSNGIPIIRIQNLNDTFAEFNYCASPVDERHRVIQGDLLFAWSGTLGSSFGARIWGGPDGVLNQHIFKVLPNEALITREFAHVVFERIQEDIAKKAHGFKSTFVHVKKSDLDATVLPLPSKPEQRAIATALRDLDGYIEKWDVLIAKKRNIQKAAMQALLNGRQRLRGYCSPWSIRRLGEIATIDPESLAGSVSPEYKFSYISLENVDNGVLTGHSDLTYKFAPSRARRKLRSQDILICTVRPNLLGHLHFTETKGEWVCSTGFSVVRCHEGVSAPEFIFSHFFSGVVNGQIDRLIAGSNYPSISSADIRGIEIPFPCFEEQVSIGRALSCMAAEISALEARRDKAYLLRRGVMQELLAGRTRLV